VRSGQATGWFKPFDLHGLLVSLSRFEQFADQTARRGLSALSRRRPTRKDDHVDKRRAVALAVPVVMPAGMSAVFKVSQARLGDRRGYVAGFVVYWAACAGLAAVTLGRRDLRHAIAAGDRLPTERLGLMALLLWPVAGAVSTRLLPELPTASRQMVATSALVAEINAPL